MKYLFLDTNIFLHFEDFEEIPWNTIPGISDECCLCIAPTVLDELDDQKDNSKGKIQKRARKYSRKLYDIIMQSKSSKYKVISIPESTPTAEDAAKLDITKNDNKILLSALKSNYDKHDIIVVSSDRHILIKASQLGLGHLLMPEEYQLHENESTSGDKSKEAQPNILVPQQFFPKVILTMEGEVQSLHFKRPTIIDIKAKLEERLEVIKAEVPEKKYTEPKSTNDYLSLLRLMPFNTKESVEKYNKERAEYINEEYAYNHLLIQKEALNQRFKKLSFEIINVGQAPSGDNVIVVEFPQKVKLYTVKESKDCFPITIPYKPSPNPMLPRETLRTMASLQQGYGKENVWLWNKDKPIKKHKFILEQETLMHNFKRDSGLSLYIDTELQDTFSIRWSIQASNAPTIEEGSLDVILDNPAQE